jgi:hypothetical protein
MRRIARDHRSVFGALALTCVGASWWGCDKVSQDVKSSSAGIGAGGGSTSSGSTGGTALDGGTGGSTEDASCASINVTVGQRPLDMLLLVDQSLDQNSGDWEASISGIDDFVTDPASNGITAGLILFPHSGDESTCDPTLYETLDVPFGLLPGKASAIADAFAATYQQLPSGYQAEMQGALMAATAWQDSNPTHNVVVVLVAYGDPDYCDQSFDDLGALSAGALSYNGVRTYVIGVPGSPITDLDKIAAAGGTKGAYIDTTALPQIRSDALTACDWPLPPPPNNQQLDPNKVNLEYTPMQNAMPQILPRAMDLVGCNGGSGWYYDSNTMPTKIILCPLSCATVPQMSVWDVLFGCPSVFN